MEKKVYAMLIFVISISILLLGCSQEKEDVSQDLGLEKVQKIEVYSSENPDLVMKVIENKKDLTEFVRTLKVDKWSMADIPSNSTKGNIFKIYQEDTVKLGEANGAEKELSQIATIITYKDSPYIKLTTNKLDFSFKIPKDAAEYLAHTNN